MMRTYDFLKAERETAEASLIAYAVRFPEVARLETLPGIGHILAAVIWSEIGDLGRFASADALVNYTGLVPSLYESGEVSVSGPITRQGPRWLRWALITAANVVTLSKGPLARRYHRLRRRKRPNVAKAALAASLARCAYGVLKHGEDYQEERWGRKPGDEMES
jgi:transposase